MSLMESNRPDPVHIRALAARRARRARGLQAHLPGLLRTAAGAPAPERAADPAVGARRDQAVEGPAVQLATAVSLPGRASYAASGTICATMRPGPSARPGRRASPRDRRRT